MPNASDPKTDRTLDRALGAYLGLAVGDALGATVEFLTPREIQTRYGVHEHIRGGGWLRLRPGQVTDDTEMSLALGEAILRERGVDAWTAAEAFSDWMRTKPVDIGNTVRRGIVHYRNTCEVAMRRDDTSAGNGACMRCLPVAIATLGQPPELVRRAVLDQAHVTHNSALSDQATLFVVDWVQAGLAGDSPRPMLGMLDDFLDANPTFRWKAGRRMENPSGYIVDTLQAVAQALQTHEDFRGAMRDVVNRGGDADTTGAILGMIAGAWWGQAAIPREWVNAVEATTRERCRRQAVELLALSGA